MSFKNISELSPKLEMRKFERTKREGGRKGRFGVLDLEEFKAEEVREDEVV